MLTLIKREIKDHNVYFLGAIILTAILLCLTVFAAYNLVYQYDHEEAVTYIGLSLPVIVMLMIGFSGMGISQMYTDRARKISAFLSTLPVSRSQILLARIVTGILAILIVVLPFVITSMVMEYLFAPPMPVYSGMIFDIFTVIFLLGFACYCLGLMTGWTAGKIAPTLGCLGLTFILSSLILVKGFGPCTKGILVLIIVACLIRTWQKFITTSL
jgi:ABC-type transport system involved in multi-copper enzyme maturation permease subunit